MMVKKSAGTVVGAVVLGIMIASCATDNGRDVQARDSESTGPAKVSPEERLEQQRQLEERQRDQQQQDRRQQDLERARQQTEPSTTSAYASSITIAPIMVSDRKKQPERIMALDGGQSNQAPSSSGQRGRSVNGELLRIEGEYFVIRDDSGGEVRLQVTNDTKMENAVQVGDKVEAQVSGRDHAETVRRMDKPKGN